MTLLDDDEWSLFSDREIAKHCKVSNTYVSKIRNNIESVNVYTPKNNNANNQDVSHKRVQRCIHGKENEGLNLLTCF